LATCKTTAAAAATSGVEAEVPPSFSTWTDLASAPKGCARLSTLSPGADALSREPYALAKLRWPLYLVSGKACWATSAALRGSCGCAEKMSSRVVDPTSIAPESTSSDGTLENPTSPRLVAWPAERATSVAALPPDGGTAAFVNERSPSPPDMQTTT